MGCSGEVGKRSQVEVVRQAVEAEIGTIDDKEESERDIMHSQRSTAAIILAAGSSSRMGAGRHKLLLPLHERPVLAHVIDAALASQARPIVVVLGHQAEQVRAQLARYSTDSAITYVENPDYLQGMSTSMRVGLAYLQTQIDAGVARCG